MINIEYKIRRARERSIFVDYEIRFDNMVLNGRIAVGDEIPIKHALELVQKQAGRAVADYVIKGEVDE